MQDNEYHCELCGDGESPLNIHHKEYFKGHEPWEYEINQLSCLCESCHESQHENVDLLKWVCSYAKLDGPENRTELAFILGGYIGIPYDGMLCFSCMEDHTAYSTAHSVGVKANEIYQPSAIKAWLASQEKENAKD
jgi:hypothetical protein